MPGCHFSHRHGGLLFRDVVIVKSQGQDVLELVFVLGGQTFLGFLKLLSSRMFSMVVVGLGLRLSACSNVSVVLSFGSHR